VGLEYLAAGRDGHIHHLLVLLQGVEAAAHVPMEVVPRRLHNVVLGVAVVVVQGVIMLLGTGIAIPVSHLLQPLFATQLRVVVHQDLPLGQILVLLASRVQHLLAVCL